MRARTRPRSLLVVAAGILPALLATPGTARAESYETWALTQAAACAQPIVGVHTASLDLHVLRDPVALSACLDLSKPLTDTTDAAFGASEVVLASAASASPTDIMDVLAGVVTLQAASLTDFQFMIGLNATDPNVYVGVQSYTLGVGTGYMVGANWSSEGELINQLTDPSTAVGCLSTCRIAINTVGLNQQTDGGPGEDGNGGNTPSAMSAFKSFPITWDPAKNHHRADGYGQYFYFKTTGYKYRSDVDFYATSMWASVQKYGDNRLKKVYMSAIPGKSMQVVEAQPRGVKRNGSSIGSTTIHATFSGEVKAGSDQGGASGGSEIGISRSYERYEGSGGGGVLHDGTHYSTWISGTKAGTTTNRSVDGVTTWTVPTSTSPNWDWEAYVTTCSNPCSV